MIATLLSLRLLKPPPKARASGYACQCYLNFRFVPVFCHGQVKKYPFFLRERETGVKNRAVFFCTGFLQGLTGTKKAKNRRQKLIAE